MRNCALLLAALSLLAGCATSPTDDRQRALSSWLQLGPGGDGSLRAIVRAGADCPTAMIDRVARPMTSRAEPGKAPPLTGAGGNRAFNPEFAVRSCELAVPSPARDASIDGRPIPLPRGEIKRIVVVGDTGCRIKVPAGGKGDPIQDCASPAAWPWPRIAAAAARARPDLVIHVGDYHYREYCDDPQRCSTLREQGVVVGYGWAGWDADFFTPAAPLLSAAPWVFVRGNHENCDRGGEGWMRFLSPLPYQACGNQMYKSATRSVLDNNLTAAAYRIDLDSELGLIVADNSGHEDYRPARETPRDVALFRQTLAVLREAPATQRLWFFSHRPVWYDLLDPASQPNALQTVLRNGLPANVQMAFAGHQHAFETINFSPDADRAFHPAGRPAQVIVGGGGTQLESLDPHSPFYEGEGGMGSKERARPDGRLYDGVAAATGLVLNRYSFLLLERDAEGWGGTVLDPDGLPITRCRLSGGSKELACRFPGH